ncbi:MAG: hypothetical protein CVV30_01860 [Methanomicrobiales archaeon HGW-Methanomicrobiales-1]|jgi:hypothetical protein|nr:MAG: hypothetical protein CVV30_01860 [Methanomicrobiales archaeon HGW-Methanomicrobiales-1]
MFQKKGEIMKTIAILAIMVCVLLVAGCTTSPSMTTPPGTVSPVPTFPGKALPDTILPMDGMATLGTGNNSMQVSLYSIEIDPPVNADNRTINIYVLARNNGTGLRQFVWFSKLTNIYGNSFGGIGISHLGSGARSGKISSGWGDAARDYVVIHSDESFATLSKGAVLDVYFMDRTSNQTSMVPDYHVAWTIDPGVIK